MEDLIIIGAAPAGLTAGLYAARARVKTVLLERLSPGGQLITTDWVENYPGFPEGISGFELVDRMKSQVEQFGLVIQNQEVIRLKLSGEKKVAVTDKEELEARERKVHIKEHPEKAISIAELCYAGYQVIGTGMIPRNWIDERSGKVIAPVSVAATITEVEVDTETGELDVLRITSAHDCGRAINPQLIENQIDLSLTLGNGWVRSEDVIIDKSTGVMLNPNLLDYKIMTMLDMPKREDLQEIIVEFPTSWGPFGAKGMSETATTTPAPAVANAIYNAIGVRIRGDHLTPDRILEALGK